MMSSSTNAMVTVVLLLSFAALLGSCSHSEKPSVTIEMGKVERVNGCHVKLDLIRSYKDGSPLGDFHFVCDVAESALTEKKWWGDQPQPLMFSMLVGDCMRLEKMWYCAEKFEPGKTVTLKAMFRTIDSDVTVIERIN